jgi:hypothetical protein
MVVALAVGAAARATPPGGPSFDVEGLVQVRTVVDGVITEQYGGRIPGRPAWVWQESWDQCRHPRPVEVTELRFIPAAAVDALLAKTPGPDRAAIERLPTTTCEVAGTTDRFFTWAVFQTPPLVPTMWSLVENTRSAVPSGEGPAEMTIVARQVAGSMGGVLTTTSIAWPADGPARTVWRTSTEIRPGFPVPDVLLGQIIPQAKAPPRRLLFEGLRARAAREAAP